MTRRSNRPDVLLAGRRLSDSPRRAFRSVSGRVLALFVATVAIGIVSTIVADHGAPAGGQVAVGTLVDTLGNPDAASVESESSIPLLPSSLLGNLASIKGVDGAAVIRWDSLVFDRSCIERLRPECGRCKFALLSGFRHRVDSGIRRCCSSITSS
jgi:hypothetical protein